MIARLLSKIRAYDPHFGPEQEAQIVDAFAFACAAHEGQFRKSGEPYVTHPLAVAENLTVMKPDIASIIAALLHDVVEDTPITIEEIEAHFGADVASLVSGLTKLENFQFHSGMEKQLQNLHKMFLSLSGDVRVVFIKLADRLHNLQTLDAFRDRPDKQFRIAQETVDFYVPLADRLGIFEMKVLLSDLCFKYLNPSAYKQLKAQIGASHEKDRRMMMVWKHTIESKMKEEKVPFLKVLFRVKNLYSLHKKLYQKEKTLDDIYDRLAMRIIVPAVSDCYLCLGIIHKHYKPLDTRFKDFIAVPKSNGYQSIHTTVSIEGKLVEIQIRTPEMDEAAQYGVAAHWVYTENQKRSLRLSKSQGDWLAQISELQKQVVEGDVFVKEMKKNILADRVFVWTPGGDVKDLPDGSIVLDFAYAIHTDLGHRYAGAKVNGRMVPLSYRLRNNDVVEIITKLNGRPSNEWVSMVKTGYARRCIKNFLREQRRDEKVDEGRSLFEKEARRLGMKIPSDQTLLDRVGDEHIKTLEDFYARLGEGDLGLMTAVHKVFPEAFFVPEKKIASKQSIERSVSGEITNILVNGMSGLLVRTKSCCDPQYGEPIIGFITRGQGVVIHSASCGTLKRLDHARFIDASWKGAEEQLYIIHVELALENRIGMFRDIANSFVQHDIVVESFQTKEHPSRHMQSYLKTEQKTLQGDIRYVHIDFYLRRLHALSSLYADLENIQGVYGVCTTGS